MANKSINMTQVRRIIQLKAEGLSKLKISESLHIHRATLENYLSNHASISSDDLAELLNEEDIQKMRLEYKFEDKAVEDILSTNSNLEEYIIY